MARSELVSYNQRAAFMDAAKDIGTTFTVHEDDTLYRQQTEGNTLFVVQSGLVFSRYDVPPHRESRSRPSGRDRRIIDGIFPAGTIAGLEIFDTSCYTSTAVSAEDSKITALTTPELAVMFIENLRLIAVFGKLVTEQVIADEEHLLLTLRGTAKQRINQARKEFEKNGVIPPNQFRLSERSGIVREEVNRTINWKTQAQRRLRRAGK